MTLKKILERFDKRKDIRDSIKKIYLLSKKIASLQNKRGKDFQNLLKRDHILSEIKEVSKLVLPEQTSLKDSLIDIRRHIESQITKEPIAKALKEIKKLANTESEIRIIVSSYLTRYVMQGVPNSNFGRVSELCGKFLDDYCLCLPHDLERGPGLYEPLYLYFFTDYYNKLYHPLVLELARK